MLRNLAAGTRLQPIDFKSTRRPRLLVPPRVPLDSAQLARFRGTLTVPKIDREGFEKPPKPVYLT